MAAAEAAPAATIEELTISRAINRSEIDSGILIIHRREHPLPLQPQQHQFQASVQRIYTDPARTLDAAEAEHASLPRRMNMNFATGVAMIVTGLMARKDWKLSETPKVRKDPTNS